MDTNVEPDLEKHALTKSYDKLTVTDTWTWKDWLLKEENGKPDLQWQGKGFGREEEDESII